MKMIGTGETSYSKKDAEALRDNIIKLRDSFLKENNFEQSVRLSHTVALMQSMIDEIWK